MERFEDWEPLVTRVVTKHFWWVWEDSASEANRRLQRSICRDDLVQEGNIALLNAIEKYDETHPSKASFKTYAYRAVYRRIKTYIQDNYSPINVCRPEFAQTTSNTQLVNQFKSAMNYTEFSDLRANRRDLDELPFAPTPPKNQMWVDAPDVEIDGRDFTEHCLKRLRSALTEKQMKILLLKHDGRTWKEVGHEFGRGREWARLQGIAAMEIARRVLRSEAATISPG